MQSAGFPQAAGLLNMHKAVSLQLLSTQAYRCQVLQVFEDREVVRLNVGGVSYTTTVATLRNAAEPSLFTAMFSGRHTLRPDEVCHAVLLE